MKTFIKSFGPVILLLLVMIAGGSYFIHLQSVKLYRTSFVLGCTWNGRADKAYCDTMADKYVDEKYSLKFWK